MLPADGVIQAIALQRGDGVLLLILLQRGLRYLTNVSVVRLVDESERGQIRRFRFWLQTGHVIFGAARSGISAFEFVVVRSGIASSNKAVEPSSYATLFFVESWFVIFDKCE